MGANVPAADLSCASVQRDSRAYTARVQEAGGKKGMCTPNTRDVNECTADNGGCEGQCCNTIGSFYCKCPKGMRLSQDGKACEDENECLELNGGCQQNCVNSAGSFLCECSMGFRLNTDGRSCVGE
nr:multiple epidermal growth factor-like domains protein 6 [Paramormyrops kingsleyae]